jgi:enoyl-CoA hydratase/carnithine racemase
MSTAEQFHVDEVSPSYWRVTFDNGPVNLLDPDTIDQLGALIARVESDPDLTVVVFSSDSFGASPQCACSGLLECCFCVTRGVPAG